MSYGDSDKGATAGEKAKIRGVLVGNLLINLKILMMLQEVDRENDGSGKAIISWKNNYRYFHLLFLNDIVLKLFYILVPLSVYTSVCVRFTKPGGGLIWFCSDRQVIKNSFL